MTIDRRKFLATSTSGLAATALVAQSLPCAAVAPAVQAAPLTIIDTHQHLWDLIAFRPPWLSGADAKIASAHDMNRYLKETEGLNVVKAVYMEVDVSPKDQDKEADSVLAIINAKKSPTVAAVISGRPGSAEFAKYIDKYRKNDLIKGVRQVLHADSAAKGLCLEPQFIKSVQLLGEMDKSFDLCMRPSELGDGAALAAQCPGTRFIVDHCGNADPSAWTAKGKPSVAPGHTVDQWKTDMGKLAALPNVICKISGIVAKAPAGWTANSLAPAINFCLDSFGPDRVVFGGDWPVCKLGASYVQWVEALKQIVAARPIEDQRKLFCDNALRFYRLG